VENPGEIAAGELEQRRREVADTDRRADLVAVELDVVAPCECLLGPVGRAVEERGPDDRGFRMDAGDELLRLELLLSVLQDRTRLVVFRVRRPLLAVEDEVAAQVDEPGADAVRGESTL
jgi:hypothetical protein